ncbi:MAG: hypothetical protein IKV60_00310 [Rikenellaceae bacterium]|nr:hypothetical protein [Rikenellaceae bacterium]
MNIFKKIFLTLSVVALSIACSDSFVDTTFQEPDYTPSHTEVGFELVSDITRTSIDPDGATTRWCVGDKIALWAMNANGELAIENSLFMLRYYTTEFNNAYFTSNIAPMTEGDYTYMLSYPQPQSVNGTLATYTLPATQSGEYDGKYDIMIAEPVVTEALTSVSRVQLNTIMRHQMHALKIHIPEGRNLYNDRFYRLEISFPNNVVGDVTFDVSNPNAKPVYTNMSNTIVVENAEGFDDGDDIWVFVLPGTVDGEVSYYVRGERRKSNPAAYNLTKEFKAGRVTPINMAIPEIYPIYTAINITITKNNLGEDFNFFDVYDANNNHMGTFPRNATNKYTILDYEGEFDADQYDNQSWRVVFDSENALVSTTLNLGDMTDYTEHTRSMEVPYLFAENFSSLAKYDGDYIGGPYTSTDAAATAGRDLSQYGLASGWTGARTGCDAAGTAILVSGRVDAVALGATRAYGRLDSPALSAIKPDKYVNVKVTFDYGGSRSGNTTYYPVGRVGYTTTSGIIDGYATQFDNNESFSGIDGAQTVPSIPTSGSATALSQSMTYNITDCTSSHRISWHVGHMGFKRWAVNNGYGWMYIDNIKVQIAK